MTTQEDNFEIDRLKLYFGEDYKINDKIIITQPSIGDILNFGEKQFYFTVNIFVANTTSYRLQLWDMGIDWNNISDYELFMMLVNNLDVESTKLLFGEVNFKDFQVYNKTLKDNTKELTFYNQNQDIEIDEKTYKHISLYIKNMFNIFPKVEKAKGKSTKLAIIEEDRENYNLHKNDEYNSTLLPLISGCLNHPGFKYKKSELKDVGIVEFMDSVQRLQIYESTTALLSGMYSGMVDTKSIDSKEFNFMRDINK